MTAVQLIKLTGENHEEIWVNCEKVLYLSKDNSQAHTLCVIHLHGQATVSVRENIRRVAGKLKCPEGH